MGAHDLRALAAHPEVDIVALCDVDENALAAAAEAHPGARLFRDWRELFATFSDGFDSVHVTTPDHMHAPIASRALALDKHTYCQKPLTRTVAEARDLRRAARRSRAVTQMGIQNHSAAPYSSARALFEEGHIGQVYEVHVWTDRPAGWWPQGVERLPGADEVPATLAWDLWLGVAPERPYKEGQYHPFSWRGWLDFGTGAQGDMACHLMDPALWFLGLEAPLSIRSDGPPPGPDSYPVWSRVHYEFPATRQTTRGPLHLTWYDGGRRPSQELLHEHGIDEELPANACLFLGTQGAFLANPYAAPRLFPAERFAGVEIPELEGRDHWFRFVDACRGGGDPGASFEYASRLTEVALLGNVALHFPHETLRWDEATGRFPARPEADSWLEPVYRSDWAL